MNEKRPCDLLIKQVTVLKPDMALYRDTAIAIHQGRIVAINRSTLLEETYRPATTIDGAGKVALPGLIDAHTHVCQQLLRGRITDEPPMIWVNFLVPYESALEPEDVYWSTLLSGVEMIKAGITCFADAGGRHMASAARAVEALGLRACIARSTMDSATFVPDTMKDTTAGAIAKTEALFDAWHGKANDRIHIWFSLRQVMTSTPALVEGIAASARQRDAGLHIHLAEHLKEVEHCMVNYGKRPAAWLDSLGFLGPDVLAAHSVVLSDREVQLAVERGATPVHCPRSNLNSHGFPKTPLFLALGSPIGLGSDGASGGKIDLFAEMRLLKSAIQASRGLPINDATVLPVEDALRMATAGGARAVRLERDIGALDVGKKADLILVDSTAPHLYPTHNLLRTLVMSATPQDVQDVIVDGVVLMRDRRLTQIDEEKVLRKANEQLIAIARRAEF
ncbi:MAG: amidohydrolase [Anaerolineae bacterium]|nr:amidohydrolase [Anaerolineae bacterium]